MPSPSLRSLAPGALGAALLLTALASCTDDPVRPAWEPVGGPVVSSPQPQSQAGDTIPGSYVVFFKWEVTDPEALAKLLVGQHGGTLRRVYTALKGFNVVDFPAAAVEALRLDPTVARVGPDGWFLRGGQAAWSMMPTTTDGNLKSWGLDRVDQRYLPFNRSYTYGSTGRGVNIYVIDTGIDTTHQEFTDAAGNKRASLDFDMVGGSNPNGDCHGHGTFVAGVAAGKTVGVARNARLRGVRVLDCTNRGTLANFANGLDTVRVNAVFPAVANMSIYTDNPSSGVDSAAARLIRTGLPLVTIAANFNDDACNHSPGRYGPAITVAASDSFDVRWTESATKGSGYGPCVDLFAPGRDITSSVPTTGGFSDASGYRIGSGTSFAAPHVAGLVARCLELKPSLTPAQIRDAVVNAATPQALDPATLNGSPDRLLYALPGWPT